MATRVTFEFSPMPIHSKSSGTHASEGTARRAPMVGATNTRTGADKPISDPSTRPSTAPMPKPISTRWVEIATCLASSPRCASSIPAPTTRSGEGSWTCVNTPLVLRIYQSAMSARGRIRPRYCLPAKGFEGSFGVGSLAALSCAGAMVAAVITSPPPWQSSRLRRCQPSSRTGRPRCCSGPCPRRTGRGRRRTRPESGQRP